MKKFAKKSTSLILAICLGVSMMGFCLFSFVGCGTATDATYDLITYSNGGMAVEYGDYMYFINGNAGFPNADIEQEINSLGDEQKGGLYRVKKNDYIINHWDENISADVVAEYTEHDSIDFQSNEMDWYDLRNYSIGDDYVTDSDGNRMIDFDIASEYTEYQIADSTDFETFETTSIIEPIVEKIIGTADYAGGIFIFDGKIYFASASDYLDQAGDYQYDKTDFYVCNIDGTNLTKIYTTTGKLIDEKVYSMPYTFNKQNGVVNLTTFEQWYATDEDEIEDVLTGYVVNTEIVNSTVRSTNTIAEDVTSAYFPVKETYAPTASTNTIYDFVYFTRAADEDDDNTFGSVLEMMRPNGEDRDIIVNNGNGVSIQGVSGDFFYYQNEKPTATSLEYTNLLSQLERSSYEKVSYVNGRSEFKKDSDGNYVLEDGNTFVSEQEVLSENYNEWLKSGTSIEDESYVAYNEEYIMPMLDVSHILIDDVNLSTRAISTIQLLPYRSFNDIDVHVVAGSETALYNISTDTSFIITGSSFTVCTFDENKLYGYDSSNIFAWVDYTQENADSYYLGGNYKTVNTDSPLVMDKIEVHDSKGNEINTYMAFNTDYNDDALDYMVVYKTSGILCGEGYAPVPCGYVEPEDKKTVVCLDPYCIDYTHDHIERDGFDVSVDPDAEEETTDETTDVDM